jgi:alpha-tubulin suppressor-like RCC1 family protein
VVSIAAGYSHSLFLKESGEVYGCGHNLYGQLADSRTRKRQQPFRMLDGAQAVTAGYYHSLVLTQDGRALATGDNDYGQLGTGSTDGLRKPLQVMTGVQAVEAGGSHSLLLTASGAVHAAGYNAYGQLGDGTKRDRLAPVHVKGLGDLKVRGMAAGTLHSLFLGEDGTVLGTGSDEDGQLGIGGSANVSTHTRPAKARLPSEAENVAAGAYHSLFLMRNSSVYASGQNKRGQLGDMSNVDRHSPVQVAGLQNVTRMAGGFQHSLFLSQTGRAWSVGANDHGQLADGTFRDRSRPVQIVTAGQVQDIAAGALHSLFLMKDGTVSVSGSDFWGQLGRGGGGDQPAAVNSLVPWSSGLTQADKEWLGSLQEGFAVAGGLQTGGAVRAAVAATEGGGRRAPVLLVLAGAVAAAALLVAGSLMRRPCASRAAFSRVGSSQQRESLPAAVTDILVEATA